MEEKVLDIESLRTRAGVMRFKDRVPHDVLPTTGQMYHDLRTAPKGEAVARVYQTVAELVPTATSEQVNSLTLDQANAVLALAGSGIEAVEQLYPNAVSPAASTSPG